jgi:signal transduction histidine kinase
VCDSIAPQTAAQKIRVEVDAPQNMSFSADAAMLRRAVLNLLLNAVDAMPTGGEIIITACRTRQGLEIEVADSGPGLSDRDRARVFEPFFTTKSRGIGLGLSIVFRIAEAHGGAVLVRNCPQGGAAFTLLLPFNSSESP